jgi:hypothetical protein
MIRTGLVLGESSVPQSLAALLVAREGCQHRQSDRTSGSRPKLQAVEPAGRDVPAPPAKGQPHVHGHLHLQSWEDRETGQRRFKTFVRAQEQDFLGAPGAAGTLKTRWSLFCCTAAAQAWAMRGR